jgi:hypothetical protein
MEPIAHPTVYIVTDGTNQPWDKFLQALMIHSDFPLIYRNWNPLRVINTGRLIPLWSHGGWMSDSPEFRQLSALLVTNRFVVWPTFCGAPKFVHGEGEPPAQTQGLEFGRYGCEG